jgi:hypothetical protein
MLLLIAAIVAGIWLLLVVCTVLLCSAATRADAESERLLRASQLRIARP